MSKLLTLFKTEGLIQKSDKKSFSSLIENMASPWQLRAEGLDRQLLPKEWAAVIYHIIKHRGFQSARKSESKTIEKNYRTMGECIYKHEKFADYKRNKPQDYKCSVLRKELIEEIEKLFNTQRHLKNVFTNSKFEEDVKNSLNSRKSAHSGERLISTIGICTFEPKEKRAPKNSYSAERFVWLSKLNNLRILIEGEQRNLTENERLILKKLLFTHSQLTYKDIQEKLNLPNNAYFNGVDDNGYNKTANKKNKKNSDPELYVCFKAPFYHDLKKAYQSAGLLDVWEKTSENPEHLDKIAEILSWYKESEERKTQLKNIGLSDALIEKLLDLPCEKFIHLSLKALKKILPFMEQGNRYDEAVKEADYQPFNKIYSNQSTSRYLPPLENEEINNPVVACAFNQARKLFNAIIKKYGMPESIHIELSRDMAKSKTEREAIETGQKKYQKEKKSHIEEFEKHFHCKPSTMEREKFRLYKEQDGICAYSLKRIDIERLLEEKYTEIDHILPRSRIFDNSQNNKALVLTAENQNKGNRTPYEYLGGAENSEKWQMFKNNIAANKKIKRAKLNHFLRKDLSNSTSSEFCERNLNDTRYICKAFKKHIENNLGKSCVVVNGSLTGFLRYQWGLTKNRSAGDLHHALDAAVIAACSRSMVQRLAGYSKRREIQYLQEIQSKNRYIDPETGEIFDREKLNQLEKDFPKPWPHFRAELTARLSENPAQELLKISNYTPEKASAVQPIRVSRRATRRNTGAAHKEIIRSIKKHLGENCSARRKPLSSLKIKDIENIVGYDDPRNKILIEKIKERLEPKNHKDDKEDDEKAFVKDDVLYYKHKGKFYVVRTVKIKQPQKKASVKVRGGIADNASMLRIDIFTKKNKFYAIPIYVNDRGKQSLPEKVVVEDKPWQKIDESYQFLFSLYQNDWIYIKNKKSEHQGYYNSFNISNASVKLHVHDKNPNKSSKGEENGTIGGIGIKNLQRFEKYHVDILGNLYKAPAETRKPLT